MCHRCIVGGGGELCLAVGTSQKSKQPYIPQFLTLGTAVWAVQTALSLGRESLEHGIDQPSPTPFPSRPWQGLFLGLAPSRLLTRSGRLSASALLHRPGRLAACQGQAHVSSRLPGEGRGQSLQRGLQPRGLRTGEEARAPACRREMKVLSLSVHASPGWPEMHTHPELGTPLGNTLWCPPPPFRACTLSFISSSLAQPD